MLIGKVTMLHYQHKYFHINALQVYIIEDVSSRI
jgi:hypothetical protein